MYNVRARDSQNRQRTGLLHAFPNTIQGNLRLADTHKQWWPMRVTTKLMEHNTHKMPLWDDLNGLLYPSAYSFWAPRKVIYGYRCALQGSFGLKPRVFVCSIFEFILIKTVRHSSTF